MGKSNPTLYQMPVADIEFLDRLVDGYYAIDFNWNIVYINDKAAALAFSTKEKMQGRNMLKLYPTMMNMPFGKAVARVMKTRNPERIDINFDRVGRWYEDYIYPTVYGISIFSRDITEQRALTDNLKFLAEASKILSTSLDYKTTLRRVAKIAVPHIADWCSVDMLDEKNNLQLVAIAHKDTKKIRWARELRKHEPVDMSSPTGSPKVMRTGKSEFYPVITEELLRASITDQARLKRTLGLIKELGGLTSLIIVPIFLQNRPVGVMQFVNADTKRYFTENHLKMAEEVASRASLAIENATLYKSVEEELSFRKRLEDELLQTQRKYDALVESNIVGVIIADLHGNISQANDAFLRMIDYTRRDLEKGNLKWTELSPPESAEADRNAVKDLMEKGRATPFEKEFLRKDGSRIPVILGVVMINPQTTECIAFVLDITERKILEERKDEFIGIASHELKTPLTSIKGYVQILERIISQTSDERVKKYLKKTNTYIDRLNSLIADLLDVSKIQAGRLQFNISEFSGAELVEDGIDSIQYTGLKHKIVKKGRIACRIRGDRHRLEQVFTNLLNNAIKYSPAADKVVVYVKINKDLLTVGIQDFGVGIPATKQKDIFERFYRVEETSREFSGLGIGLYISSQIIARHGGKMWVKSKKGKGSTFFFTLPIKKKV